MRCPKLVAALSTICFLTALLIQAESKEWVTSVPYYGEKPSDANELKDYLKNVWRAVIKTRSEYPSFDGWYNNRAHPDWGAADTPMLRRLPSAYADGISRPSGQNRPEPMDISKQVMGGATGTESERGRTTLLVFFGQQVVDEILDVRRPSCPPEYFNIRIPKGHHLNPQNQTDWYMPLERSRYDMDKTGYNLNSPRDQLNEITPWLDGSVIYGRGKAWSNGLRAFEGGELKSTKNSEGSEKYRDRDFPAVNSIRMPMENYPPPTDHFIKDANRLFRLGNPRGNENPFLLTFGIMWYRFHNGVAKEITKLLEEACMNKDVNNEYNIGDCSEIKEKYDEKIFNEARKWVIAVHQKIVVYDWLPFWLQTTEDGLPLKLPEYQGYQPNVHPQIMHVFQSAAMRFGHTLVPPGVHRRERKAAAGEECDFQPNKNLKTDSDKEALRTCNVYWNSQEPVNEYDIDGMILGMSSQITEREDTIVAPDLRGYVYGRLDFSRRDLMAINIQRGRDHGLPDYNTARRYFGLDEITDFTQINPKCANETAIDDDEDCFMIRGLMEVYDGKLDDIDIWPGGLAETTGDGPGPLFRAIMKDQFMRIRDADRFWWENKLNGLFDDNQRTAINSTNIRNVILSVTDIEEDELASNPFFFRQGEEKCRYTVNQAKSEGFDIDESICSSGDIDCESVRDALSNANNISDFDLNRLADCTNTFAFTTDPCPAPPVIDDSDSDVVAPCSPWKGFDYFTGSEASFILSFGGIVVFAVGCVVVLVLCARARQNAVAKMKRTKRAASRKRSNDTTLHEVTEWQGDKEGTRTIKINFDTEKKCILVFTDAVRGRPIRIIDCKNSPKICLRISIDKSKNYVSIKKPNDYDLVLAFDDADAKQEYLQSLRQFCSEIGIDITTTELPQKVVLGEAITKRKRQKTLDKFFRIVFSHAFDIRDSMMERMSADQFYDIMSCELTIYEFADALSMKPNSMFAKNMFEAIDKDKNGYVSFREFLDMTVIFSKGDGNEKAKLLFDMYDVTGNGLSKADFRNMLKSFMELANTSVEADQIDQVIESMFTQAGLSQKEVLNFDDFSHLLKDHNQYLDSAQLTFGVKKAPTQSKGNEKTVEKSKEKQPAARNASINVLLTNLSSSKNNGTADTVDVRLQAREKPKANDGWLSTQASIIANYVENYRLHIFWVTLYTILCLGVFSITSYEYAITKKHATRRAVFGYGVTVTRGAASVQMLTFSTLLLTMSRNLITALRETFFNRFIPFDSAIWFHKYVAYIALLFTLIHCIGHSINLYHLSTQPVADLACLFRNFYRPSHILPKFHYWCWGTITGVTGVLLLLLIIILYVFAQQYARRNLFRAFWLTHKMFYILFILMVLHGSGVMIQLPVLYVYLLGPLIVFTLDKLVSMSRKKVEIPITKAEILPSDVTGLTFKRPAGFEYKSGQWVRIACLDLGGSEYHPFTLTSAPHEDNLSLHIRAVGPWTTNIRRLCDPGQTGNKPYPKLYLDGPFGEGHQDWYKYDIAVLVGGGIGVTPFASILKDIVNNSSLGARFTCKKVYFIWVTRSQKQFEWLVDIIREVEENDKNNFVSVHLFITQFYQKFDLRTTMLYICERHFQKISRKSLFTGLRSITHFGRPDFSAFLGSLQDEHPGVSKIGVFSCGPPPMTHGVEEACTNLNKIREGDDASFVHHYENF